MNVMLARGSHKCARQLHTSLPGRVAPPPARAVSRQVVDVKRAYGLTVDPREAAALEQFFRGCASTAMEPMVCRGPSSSAGSTGRATSGGDDVLTRYDDNRNVRITCKEARRDGITPVHRSHPAYQYMRDGDGDGDGVVCE